MTDNTPYDSLNLSPDLKQIAFHELGETDELRASSLVQLRQMIMSLPNDKDRLGDTSDRNLIRFLRSRKYDLDRALQSTIDYQHFLHKHFDVLKDITLEELSSLDNFLTVIEEPDPNGRVILIMKPAKGLPRLTPDIMKKYPRIMIRTNFFYFEEISHNPRAQICGMIIIDTYKGITMWDHITLSKLAPISDHLATIQHFQTLGTRFKGAFIFEEPIFFSFLWFCIRPFLSEKMKNRCFLCGHDYSLLREKIKDITILPELLGGKLPDDDPRNTAWIKEKIEKYFASSSLTAASHHEK